MSRHGNDPDFAYCRYHLKALVLGFLGEHFGRIDVELTDQFGLAEVYFAVFVALCSTAAEWDRLEVGQGTCCG